MRKLRAFTAAFLAACIAVTAVGCVGATPADTVQTVVDIGAEVTPAPGTEAPQKTEAPVRTPDPNVGVGVLPGNTPEPEASDMPDGPGETPYQMGHSEYPVDPNKPMVALTFDDGPSKHTIRILDALEQHGGRATFFCVGTQLEKYASIAQRAHEMGCEVASHTYSHKNLSKISVDEMIEEIEKNNALLEPITGQVTLLRPPYGAGIKDSAVIETVRYPYIMWSIDTLDWSTRDTDSTVAEVRNKVEDGAIILMHDLYEPTAAAAEILIPELIEQGYQLVTITELFTAKGITLEPGKYYRSAH